MTLFKKLGIAGGTILASLTALGSIPSTICACGNAASNFVLTVLAHPMESDPAMVRTRLLKVLPKGSSIDDVRKFSASISPAQSADATLCAHVPTGVKCRFLVRGNMWRDSGFELHFALDSSHRVSDVQISRF
jgi:hypothetical protein